MAQGEELRSMQEAWRAYLDLALGVTEVSRKRALTIARKLVGRGGATAEQLQSMTEDLLRTSLANRESLVRLVRFELDKALGRVGLATAEEVAELTRRVRELEEELKVARAGTGPAVTAPMDDELAASTTAIPAAAPPIAAAAPTTAVAKKAVAKKVAPTTAVAKKTVAKEPVKAVAKKAVAKKAVAKKTVAPEATDGPTDQGQS